MSPKIYIEEEECIGCEGCVEICPEVFQFDNEKERAFVIRPEGGPSDLLEEAIEMCPEQCIRWIS